MTPATFSTNCETRPQITLGVRAAHGGCWPRWSRCGARGLPAQRPPRRPDGARVQGRRSSSSRSNRGSKDFKADLKWQEYRPYCDQFYFAVAPEFPQAILPDEPGLIVGRRVRRRGGARGRLACSGSGPAQGPDPGVWPPDRHACGRAVALGLWKHGVNAVPGMVVVPVWTRVSRPPHDELPASRRRRLQAPHPDRGGCDLRPA